MQDTFEGKLNALLEYCTATLEEDKIAGDGIYDPLFNLYNYVNGLNTMKDSDSALKDRFAMLLKPYVVDICMQQDYKFLSSGIILDRSKSEVIERDYEYYIDLTEMWRLMNTKKRYNGFLYNFLMMLSTLFGESSRTLVSLACTYRADIEPNEMMGNIFSAVTDALEASGHGDKLGTGAAENIKNLLANVTASVNNDTSGNPPDPKSIINGVMQSTSFLNLLNMGNDS